MHSYTRVIYNNIFYYYCEHFYSNNYLCVYRAICECVFLLDFIYIYKMRELEILKEQNYPGNCST